MEFQEMLNILQGGGWVMILLAILALILYVTAFDVLHFVYSGNLNAKSEFNWRDWVLHPEKAGGRVGEIIRYTQGGDLNAKRIEQRFTEVRHAVLSRVNHRLVLLNTLVATAPLAGLLGTVIGMLETFGGLAASGGESMARVAGGIEEALLTTQTGLLIALPGVFAVLVIRRKKHALEASIARLESLTLLNRTALEHEDEEDDRHFTPAREERPAAEEPVIDTAVGGGTPALQGS